MRLHNYEEEVRKRYGQNVRIEALRFHRTKPAIIDDKHARNALAISYVKYAESIISEIQDEIYKRKLSNFKQITKYEEVILKYNNQAPDYIDKYDVDAIEEWRRLQIEKNLRNLHLMDKFGNLNRLLKRDLRIKENIQQSIFKNFAPSLILWDIFRYYLTTSKNSRKIRNGPFPYIRVELDRQQRKIFQTDYSKVIGVLNQFSDIKIIPIEEKDLLLYEKFKFEKQIKNSNIKFNNVALGAALIHLNSDVDIEMISNAFNINESKIKKEIKNVDNIKNPKSDKSKKFLNLIKK